MVTVAMKGNLSAILHAHGTGESPWFQTVFNERSFMEGSLERIIVHVENPSERGR
jgi:hypothetical protein